MLSTVISYIEVKQLNLTAVTELYESYDAIKKCTIICCADHGVAAENVSAYPKETTAQMVRNYLESEGAAANVFANFAHSDLLIVDVGVDADLRFLRGIVDRKIARGTNNIAEGAAMTRNQAERSIRIGMRIVDKISTAGYNCFLPGEMGIANTTASAAMASVLLQVDPERVTGRGTNISDERFRHKLEIVKRAIAVNKLKTKRARDPIEVLAKVGGFELGCMAGIILGAHRHDALVILDGFNSSVAALIACLIEPDCRENLLASHIGREPGHELILDALQLMPLFQLDLALGEAIGSSILARVLDKLTLMEDDYAFNEDAVEDEVVLRAEDIPDMNIGTDGDEADDDDFEVELSIYNGSGLDLRFNSYDEDEFSIEVKRMGRDHIAVTDRTFNFYLNTMPTLDHGAMERSQNQLDRLSKPCRSLGLLEEIAVQIAGISGEDLPSSHLKKNIICFTDKVQEAEEYDANIDNPEWDAANPLLDMSDTTEDFNIPITFAVVKDGSEPSTAFDFGRAAAEDVSFKTPLLGLTLLNDVAAREDFNAELEELLLDFNGKLKYDADEFLKYVPPEKQCLVSAVIGAIVAAAHNSSLVIVDIGAVELIARYVEELCPMVRPYILHASRLVLPDPDGFDDELDGESICIAMEVIQAALEAANEMKTLEEAGVDNAVDGLGRITQTD